MRRSTDDSAPVLRRVVMASVAIERFWSVISCSKSTLHEITACGCFIEICSTTGNYTLYSQCYWAFSKASLAGLYQNNTTRKRFNKSPKSTSNNEKGSWLNKWKTHLVKRSNGSESKRRFGWWTEHLKDRNGRREFRRCRLRETNDRRCSLVDHHFTFVSKTRLDELK